MNEQPSIRISKPDVTDGILFQAFAPPGGLHPALGGGLQVVLLWTREQALDCLGRMLFLLNLAEFRRHDERIPREVVPYVFAFDLDERCPRWAACRVAIAAQFARPYNGLAELAVELSPAKVGVLAERLMRRCGLRRVYRSSDTEVAWEEVNS